MNDEIVKKYEETTLRKTIKKEEISSSDGNDQSLFKKKKWIKLGIFISICIIIGIILLLYFLVIKELINKKDNSSVHDKDPFSVIIPTYNEDNEKLESEFEFKTLVGDLRRVHVIQRFVEDRLYEGQKIQRKRIRNTTYDIFIISESNPEDDFINYYNKKFNSAISIVSECFISENEECVPETLVDLSETEVHNTRNLEEKNDLKDIPIPLCLFNLTNNDVITSIKCPESFSEDKKKLMVLDLYFFRPPGIKRTEKEEMNITITKELRGEELFIRETNGGICDIENSLTSFCTTDMNTTTDKEGRILHYEEEAYMKIETDELNSYKKLKITNLVDITNETLLLNPNKYNSSLNELLTKLNPYMKYDELFSKDDFEEVLIINKKGMKEAKKILKGRNRRKLQEGKPEGLIENTLVDIDGNSGIKIEYNIINNPGKDSEYMEANSELKIENHKNQLTSSKKSSSSIYEIINSLVILSQAGNNLAAKLLQNLNSSLVNMTDYINDEITSLYSLIKYKDISDIFDATLSLDSINRLPFAIIQESSNLKTKLEQLLNSIENGAIKKNLKILNTNIYQYTEESHQIINELFENLSELSKALNSGKSKLTEISTYYLNNTNSSYLSNIEIAERILMNYYKDEYNLINPEVEKVLKVFEDSITDSLKKQNIIIDNLYEKIENGDYSIEDANVEEIKTIKNNLYYLKNYMNEIINKIETKVKKEMDIKDNGYLLTDYDINSNMERSNNVITNAKEIAKKLDNDSFIDKKFDEIMTNFRQNYTNIQKFMDTEQIEKFPLNEQVLRVEHFSSDVLSKMERDINQNGVSILNGIRKENEEYLNEKDRIIREFLQNEEDYLNKLTFEIDSLFTEKKLGEIAQLYDTAYKSCITKTKNELNNNKNSASNYFNNMVNYFNNNNEILKLLKQYKSDKNTLLKHNPWSSLREYTFVDTVNTKYRTDIYSSKYEAFIESFAKSKEFINNEIYEKLLNEYKALLFKLREALQKFKNNKMTSQYPDTSEFFFIDNHIHTIETLYDRLNKKISESIFNNNYIKIFDDFKIEANDNINKIVPIVNQNNNIIKSKPYTNNVIYDICLTFKRKITYTCTNGAKSTYSEGDKFCFPVNSQIMSHSINTDSNYIKFKNTFNDFYSSINDRVNKYSAKIANLKNSLLLAEKFAINKNYNLNYLKPIQNVINSLLTEKYGEELIKSSYNYYQRNIESLMEPLLNSISEKWIESFDILVQEIRNNIDNFKNSKNEFYYMGTIYSVIIKNNITKNYFNSIVTHQKNEFNYTITYYYNVLLKLVKATHQYIINKIPNNKVGYNNILNMRKNEVNEVFLNLIDIIKKSEVNSLDANKQCNILQVMKTDFFKINEVLSNNVLGTEQALQPKISEIFGIRFPKSNDEFSLTSRFYLENQHSKIQVDELYDQINRQIFIILNLEEFNDILTQNWIFDQDEFINELNNVLYNSNLEIDKEFLNQKSGYYEKLEKYITESFTKETLLNKINDLYQTEIKDLSNNQIQEIENNIKEILNKIKQYIIDESNSINKALTSYNKNFTRIKNRINSYKTEIFNKLNVTIFNVINTFYNRMIVKVHEEYVLAHINQCVSASKLYTETYEKFDLINSSYKIGDIIDDIISNITVEIRNFSKNQMDYMYKEKYTYIKTKIGIDNLKKLINDQIDQEFNSKLLPVLEKKSNNEGITGYNEYDFNTTIITTINSLIETNMNKINNIMNSSKGTNYDININSWERDCSLIFEKVEEIKTSFTTFMNNEKNSEDYNFDQFLQNVIKDNFNNLLTNVIPSFGNDFFERIIKYNENFKISSLYNSLTYSLSQTISYYLLLRGDNNQLNALTKDLKFKLFTLNNLDSKVQDQNNEVIKLLKKEANQFITNSMEFLINKYKSYLINDLSIELSFNDIINDKIKTNFNSVQIKIETDYQNLMNKYFKEQLIESYSRVMNMKTFQMIQTIKDEREQFKSEIDDYFTLETDEVLSDINLKLNKTLNSINKYNEHFNNFSISKDLGQFLNNYGENSVKPNFQQFINLVNEATKNKIILTVDQNSLDYINSFNLEEFNEKIQGVFSNIKEEFFDNINNTIKEYGIEEYPNNLDSKINEIGERKRLRRGRVLTDEEISNIITERVADKELDNTFNRILTSSNNAKVFINGFKMFDEFIAKIERNIINFNTSYKNSKNLIINNKYEEETHNILIQNLDDLKNMTINYYNNISEIFIRLKNYLNDSINEIDNYLKECANTTYNTFGEKYINISKEVKSFNIDDSKNEEDTQESISVPNQNKIIDVNYTISGMKKNAKFQFDLIFEDAEIKKPRVKLSIINQSKPNKFHFDLIEPINQCGKVIEKLDVPISNVNYTLNINFFTNSSDLYVSSLGDFEDYYISKQLLEIEEKITTNCIKVGGNEICVPQLSCDENNPQNISKVDKLVPRKKINDFAVLHMN